MPYVEGDTYILESGLANLKISSKYILKIIR